MNLTFHTPSGIEGESMRIIQQELEDMGIILEPDCADVDSMSPENRQDYTGTRQSLIDQGYSPCGTCKP